MKINTIDQAYKILDRRTCDDAMLKARVTSILDLVEREGDRAVAGIAASLGDNLPGEISLTSAEHRIGSAKLRILKKSLEGIEKFALATAAAAKDFTLKCGTYSTGLRWRPVSRAGCYVPGGRFPLASTALMTITAAKAAGVGEINVCSPDSSDEILAACSIAGADRFFRVGGAQAIAAMTFGTEMIPRADVIAGPGNRWVTEAKRQVQGRTGIDMLAGPSEIALIVDVCSNPALAALDLLAQIEHDEEASAWCVSLSGKITTQVLRQTALKAEEMGISAAGRINFLNVASMDEAAEFCNTLAPEHLQLSVSDYSCFTGLFTNYGALFLGEKTAVAMGDYSAGPNHTLPTGGAARYSGGLTPFTFLRAQGWVKNSGSQLADLAGDFAEMEGLIAHRNSCRCR